MNNRLFFIALIIFSFSFSIMACNSDDNEQSETGTLKINFNHLWNDQNFNLNTALTSSSGSNITINTLRYWVSNVQLEKANGSQYIVPEAYFLIEQTAENTRTQLILEDVPVGEYTKVNFGLGVDANTNASLDAAQGELDAGIGMSWNWNTGYIFYKAEGTSDDIEFKVHVGTNDNYNLTNIALLESLSIQGASESTLDLNVNVEKVFNNIDFNETPVIMVGPADTAANALDNHRQSFEYGNVTNP